MKKHLLVTGARGLLGSAVVRVAASRYEVTATSRKRPDAPQGTMSVALDLSDTKALREFVMRCAPEAIIHCAAETGVDFCEDHPDDAVAVNAEVPGILAAAAHRVGATVIFVSTDAVFDGRRGGYVETDPLAPVGVYARSKALGEQAVAAATSDHVVVRTNLYGWSGTARQSLAEWVLDRLRAGREVPGFTDVVFNPLFTSDLAAFMLTMLERELRGVYHLGATDTITKFEFSRRIATLFGFDPACVVPVTLDSAHLRSPRPQRSWLNVSKIEAALERRMPSIDDGLHRFRQRAPRAASSTQEADVRTPH
jgi:dTDP-4-dehydrorhamnose reductase